MGSRWPYVKGFEDTSMQWRNLSYPARALFSLLHFSGVEPDGTVAVLRSPDEPVHTAIIRWVGVARHWRRGIAEPTNELLRRGYIYIDGDRVKLANHVERQAWRGGKIPAAFIEPHDPVTGEVRDTNGTSTGRQRDVNGTSTRHQQEPNVSESQGATMQDRANPPSSASASKEQEVTYRQDVGRGGDDAPWERTHHPDESTGEVNDDGWQWGDPHPDDLCDPTPEEADDVPF